MAVVVHASKILADQREGFTERLKQAQERLTAIVEEHRDELTSIGIGRIVMATTPEVASDGLLVTIYEADDPSSVDRLYELDWVKAVERQNHGVFIAPHGHDGVSKNVGLVDVRVSE